MVVTNVAVDKRVKCERPVTVHMSWGLCYLRDHKTVVVINTSPTVSIYTACVAPARAETVRVANRSFYASVLAFCRRNTFSISTCSASGHLLLAHSTPILTGIGHSFEPVMLLAYIIFVQWTPAEFFQRCGKLGGLGTEAPSSVQGQRPGGDNGKVPRS